MGEISLDTVRAAAKHVYDVAVRTPLVRLDPPGGGRAGPAGAGPLELYLKLETVVSGGNIDLGTFASVVGAAAPAARTVSG